MGNSLSILTKCLPQEQTEEGVAGEENDGVSSVIKQKRELAPKPMEEEEEWGEFEDTFDDKDGDKSKSPLSNREELQKKLALGPLSSSRDSILPLSTPTKSSKDFSLSNSMERNQSVVVKNETASPSPPLLSPKSVTSKSSSESIEGVEKSNGRSSLTQAQTGITTSPKFPSEPLNLSQKKTQAKDIPSSKDLLPKENKPVRSPKMAEEKPQDPTIEPDVDFFSDMTVKYIPPKKAEIKNNHLESIINRPRRISVERDEEEKDEDRSTLGKIQFIDDKDEKNGGGGWGNDDLGDMEGIDDVDLDHSNVREEVFKSPVLGSSESAIDSPRTPRNAKKGLADTLNLGEDDSDF